MNFSKAFGAAGCRVGCVISNQENIELIGKFRQMYEISGVSMKFCEWLLDNTGLIEDYWKDIERERNFLTFRLKKIGDMIDCVNALCPDPTNTTGMTCCAPLEETCDCASPNLPISPEIWLNLGRSRTISRNLPANRCVLDPQTRTSFARSLRDLSDGWMEGSDREPTPGFRQRAGPAPRRSPHTAQMRVSPQPMGYPVGMAAWELGPSVFTPPARAHLEALPASLPLEPTHVDGRPRARAWKR